MTNSVITTTNKLKVMKTKRLAGISLAGIFAISIWVLTSIPIPFVAADEELNLKAILLDFEGNKVGEAKYQAEGDEPKLKIKIKDFVSDEVFVVLAESTQIGLIATNSDGKGEIGFKPSPVLVVPGNSINIEDETGVVISGKFNEKNKHDEDEDDDEKEIDRKIKQKSKK